MRSKGRLRSKLARFVYRYLPIAVIYLMVLTLMAIMFFLWSLIE
jgi:hypothetical protein